MTWTQIGVAFNFLGTICLGISTQIGVGVGWGGPIVWRGQPWRLLNVLGWVLLALGFAVQLLY